MKYHGTFHIGSNDAGKGDRDRFLNVKDSKERKKISKMREETLGRIFDNKESKKEVCSKCGKNRKIVKIVYKHNGEILKYCVKCRGKFIKQKR
jgi:hypothetical protein